MGSFWRIRLPKVDLYSPGIRLVLAMLFGCAAFLLFNGSVSLTGHAKQSYGDQKTRALTDALAVLEKTKHGRELIAAVERRMDLHSSAELIALFHWGEASKTDAVLTRKFNPRSGKEQRERLVSIILKKDQAPEDLVLDIAHELTHAGSGPNWDPYDPELTAGKYIFTAIEGVGGEIDAMVSECIVGAELGIASGPSASRCERYAKDGSIDREKVKADLYKVGKWKRELIRRLGLEAEIFPLMSEAKPQLYSSTGRAPYPIALLSEFQDITDIACENSRKRLSTLPTRAPAAVETYKEMATLFVNKRCRSSNL
jgi:hypothetical protein